MNATPRSDRPGPGWLRPWLLLASVLTYTLGLGVVHYLGQPLDVPLAAAGAGWLLTLQAGMYLLEAAFAASERRPRMQTGHVRAIQQATVGAFALLAVSASLTVVLFARTGYHPAALVLMLVYFLLMSGYALPPVRAARRGYGEIILAAVVSNLVPVLAFVWQSGAPHRLLALTTFALPLLHLAAFLALELETYASDVAHLRYTLLVRLGWQEGMRVHNVLVLAALLMMGAALWAGLSVRVGLPALLAFPVGAFQLWYLGRIREGAPPHWNLLRVSALSLYVLPTYLMAFALWMH